MRKSIAVLLLAALAALSAAQLIAAVVPPIGLAPGSQYQLIFVTSDRQDATSSNIANYNAFVAAEAALNPLLPAATWHAVASTSTIDANVNAPSSGLPVYNTQGLEVATGATGLYTPNLVNAVNYDEFGLTGTSLVWTGSLSAGSAVGASPMGGGLVTFGDPHQASGGRWAEAIPGATSPSTILGPLYALSSPITVPTPEPASLTLLVTALLAIGGMRFVRWQQRV
jgi:hypothetical protein